MPFNGIYLSRWSDHEAEGKIVQWLNRNRDLIFFIFYFVALLVIGVLLYLQHLHQ